MVPIRATIGLTGSCSMHFGQALLNAYSSGGNGHQLPAHLRKQSGKQKSQQQQQQTHMPMIPTRRLNLSQLPLSGVHLLRLASPRMLLLGY